LEQPGALKKAGCLPFPIISAIGDMGKLKNSQSCSVFRTRFYAMFGFQDVGLPPLAGGKPCCRASSLKSPPWDARLWKQFFKTQNTHKIIRIKRISSLLKWQYKYRANP
jgi:hypothetical protein